MQLSRLHIGILGLGQIGGSLAAGLRSIPDPPAIVGYDLKPDLLAAARERLIVTDAAASESELVAGSDVVIIALPIGEIIALLHRQRESLLPKMAVVDTGSVKQEIMTTADQLHLTNFIGGHPLAGTERRGVSSWNCQLFETTNFFLTRGHSGDDRALEITKEIVRSLGAVPIETEASEHDHMLAVTSHLSHVIAYSLKHTFHEFPGQDTAKVLYRSPSFLNIIRVSESDPEMVMPMLWHNRRNLSSGLSAFIRKLRLAQAALDHDDESVLRRFLGLDQGESTVEGGKE